MPLIKVCYLILFSLSFFAGQAQDTSDYPLRRILEEAETRYNISFTYADQSIEGIFLTAPDTTLTLPEFLRYVERATSLDLEQIDERFIAVRKVLTLSSSFCGTVRDKITGEVIEGVVVTAGSAFTITNANGYFEFSEENFDSLTFQTVNYQQLAVPAILSSDCQEILLDPKIITLSEVVIKDYITRGIEKTKMGSIMVATERLGILPGLTEPDILLTIQAMPGIQSISEKVSDINIRAGTHDQNLITWDGIKMYQTGHFFGLISSFNPYISEHVELIRNGTPARLGDGVSGTLLINSDDDVSESFSGSAGINLINADVFAKIPVSQRTALHLSGRRSFTDLITTPTYKKYYQRIFANTDVADSANTVDDRSDEQRFYFYDFSVKVLHDITERDKIRVNGFNSFNTVAYDESAIIANTLEKKTSNLSQETLAGGIMYRRDWPGILVTKVHATISRYQLIAVNQDIQNQQRLLQENEVLEKYLGGAGSAKISSTLELEAGYQLRETGISNFDDINNPTFSRFVKEVIRTHAVYGQGIVKLKKMEVTAGIRVNYFDKLSEYRIEPRIVLHQEISNYLSVNVMGELKSQITTQVIDFQSDFLGVEKRRWLLANDGEIPVITSRQLSIGLNYQKPTFFASMDVYLKQVDGISTSSQGFQDQLQFVRTTGSYVSKGIDLLINQKFTERINSWLSYSVAQNTYQFPSLDPSEFPSNLDVRHIATLGTNYMTKRVEASVGLNYHSGKPYTPASEEQNSGNQIEYGPPNSHRIDDYLRLDVSIRYSFRLSSDVSAQIGASVWNLLNRENPVNTFYRADPEGEVMRMEEYSLGFTPNLIFRVSF